MVLDELPQVSQVLQKLFEGEPAEAQFFQNNLRRLNAQSAFGAVKVNDETVRRFGLDSAFKSVGQVQSTTESIHVEQGNTQPKCIQIYFCDTEFQDRTRATNLFTFQ